MNCWKVYRKVLCRNKSGAYMGQEVSNLHWPAAALSSLFAFASSSAAHARLLRQRGPYLSTNRTDKLESNNISVRMVNIHPTPTPWIPGSMATLATALFFKKKRRSGFHVMPKM